MQMRMVTFSTEAERLQHPAGKIPLHVWEDETLFGKKIPEDFLPLITSEIEVCLGFIRQRMEEQSLTAQEKMALLLTICFSHPRFKDEPECIKNLAAILGLSDLEHLLVIVTLGSVEGLKQFQEQNKGRWKTLVLDNKHLILNLIGKGGNTDLLADQSIGWPNIFFKTEGRCILFDAASRYSRRSIIEWCKTDNYKFERLLERNDFAVLGFALANGDWELVEQLIAWYKTPPSDFFCLQNRMKALRGLETMLDKACNFGNKPSTSPEQSAVMQRLQIELDKVRSTIRITDNNYSVIGENVASGNVVQVQLQLQQLKDDGEPANPYLYKSLFLKAAKKGYTNILRLLEEKYDIFNENRQENKVFSFVAYAIAARIKHVSVLEYIENIFIKYQFSESVAVGRDIFQYHSGRFALIAKITMPFSQDEEQRLEEEGCSHFKGEGNSVSRSLLDLVIASRNTEVLTHWRSQFPEIDNKISKKAEKAEKAWGLAWEKSTVPFFSLVRNENASAAAAPIPSSSSSSPSSSPSFGFGALEEK